jgi:hypothetical protein
MKNTKNKYLYHFTKRETLIEHILPNLELKLSSLDETNDLVENKLLVRSIIANAIEVIGAYTYLNLSQEIYYLLKEVCKICCFSDDYNLSRMWATYGNRHKGVCLRIDYEVFCKENKLKRNKSYLRKVVYKSKLNYESMTRLSHKNDSNLRETILKAIRNNIKTIFFTKQRDWISESEVRYLTLEKKDFCLINESLDGIILGEEFEDKYLPSILNQLDKNIEIFKIQALSDGHLHLNKNDK